MITTIRFHSGTYSDIWSALGGHGREWVLYKVPVNGNLIPSCKFRVFYGKIDIPLKLFGEETLYVPIYKLAFFTPHTLLSSPPYNFLFIIFHITLNILQTSVACFTPSYNTLSLPQPIQRSQRRHDTFSTTIWLIIQDKYM